MDTQNLKLFLHLADTLHFGKTSVAFHMSPSTLSRQIQRIEDEAGRLLFERDNRSVTLTEYGVKFQQYARDSLERWQVFHLSLNRDPMKLKGEISMYCSVTAGYSVLSDLLAEFRERRPLIEIILKTGDAASSIEKVIKGEVDIVIAAKPDHLTSKLDFVTIAESPLLFIAPKTVSAVSSELSAPPIDWRRIPMIVPERGLARKRINRWFKQQGIKPNIYAQVSGNEGIVSMVNLGFGVGVVPDLVINNSPFKDKVTILDIPNPLKSYHVGVCVTRKKLANPLVHAFWEIAKKKEIEPSKH